MGNAFKSFNISYEELVSENDLNKIPDLINNEIPMVIVINIHPYQTYMPKISSRVTDKEWSQIHYTS